MFWVIAPKQMKIGRCGSRHWNRRKTFFPMPQTSSSYHFLFRSYNLKQSQLPDKNEVFIGQLCQFWVIAPKRIKIGRSGLRHWQRGGVNLNSSLFPIVKNRSISLHDFSKVCNLAVKIMKYDNTFKYYCLIHCKEHGKCPLHLEIAIFKRCF